MSFRQAFRTLAFSMAVVTMGGVGLRADVVDFDDLYLAPDSYQSGPMPDAVPDGDDWVEWIGSFTSGGATFVNQNLTYGAPPASISWSGFAYSNMNDRQTAGYLNQYSSFAADSSPSGGNFAVAYGFRDQPFDPETPDDFGPGIGMIMPSFNLPAGALIQGMYVTNTTYTALTIRDGDAFAAEFETGDWYKLTAYGFTSDGLKTTELYLADYRSADAADHYILDSWTYLDLSALAGAEQIWLNVTSSDVGAYGMNTPGYFAIDDVTYSIASVPEPSSLAAGLAAVAIVGGVLRSRRGRASLFAGR